MNLFKKSLLASAIAATFSGCSVISPYMDKAAELSQESSTKTLEASIYYLCDRSRSGDLLRRYPEEKELLNHFKWCLEQKKQKESVAPEPNND